MDKNFYLIKVTKFHTTQQICGCGFKECARAIADKLEERLKVRYGDRYAVKREYCSYGGRVRGYHFTLL